MGQFIKKVAFCGCVIAGTSGVATAQSTWQWPSRPMAGAKPENSASLWDQIPAGTSPVPALVGPSDFQFPTPEPGLIEPKVEALGDVRSAASLPPAGHSWDGLIDRSTLGPMPPATGRSGAKYVNWEAIYGRGTPPRQAAAQPSVVVPAVPEISPSDWHAEFDSKERESIHQPSDLKMVGPMDQVAPTVIAAEQISAAVAMPGSLEPSNFQPSNRDSTNRQQTTKSANDELAGNVWQSPVPSPSGTLIVDEIFPQPGTELVTPIELNAARQSATQPTSDSAIAAVPALPAVNLLNMQAVSGGKTPTEPDVPLAELVAGTSGQKPGSYVLQSVKEPFGKPQPETIVPIDIIPFSRLVTSQEQLDGIVRTYDAATMTGPLKDPGMLFSKLHVEDDFRQQAFLPSVAVRTSTDPFSAGEEWMQHNYAWVTPTFYHRPLYFEQTNLERYGIGPKRWVQPFHSAAHFFGSIGLMPYKLTTQHPCEHVYTLGHGRPGDCVNFQRKTLLGQSYPMEALRYFDDYSGYN